MKSVCTAVVLFLSLSICLPLAESENASGSLWIHNTNTSSGRNYLSGFIRGYIDGKMWGLDRVEEILNHAEFHPNAPVDKEQIQSKLFLDNLYYSRALEAENIEKTMHQVTRWYKDPMNREIPWTKLLDLALGQVNGLHANYVQYQLRWLQDASAHKRVDWFHTIDPTSGTGRVIYFDENGKMARTEWVR